MKVFMLGRGKNLVSFMENAIKSLGGNMPVVDVKEQKKAHSAPAESTHSKSLDSSEYYVDHHGSVRRRNPKRDKSMSARQWKKLKKSIRRSTTANL